MPGRAVRRDMHVIGGIGPIRERPEHRIGVGRIDVLADRDANLSAVREQRRRPVQPAPNLGAGRALRVLHKDDLAQIGKWLMQDNAPDARDPEPCRANA